MDWFDAVEPPPRVVDGAILVLVSATVLTGLSSLTVGQPAGRWVFVVHGAGGLALLPLLGFKLRRVAHRLRRPSLWDRGTVVSALLGVLTLAAIATGLVWTLVGGPDVGPWTLLSVHMALGLVAVPVLLVHLRRRFRLPRPADVRGRRTALQLLGLAAAGALAWRAQQALAAALGLAGGSRRFTGSLEEGSRVGNAFPVTSWVADDPAPVDRAEWTLTVTGAVARERALDYADLSPGTSTDATLDCTSGWYSEHVWAGVRVGELLDAAGPAADARWVRFRSVTGYRFSLPIAEARAALLATHVDGEALGHGHGAPARLVAPGRRGFQWVKWVDAVEVRRRADPGQWVAIFTSGFDG